LINGKKRKLKIAGIVLSPEFIYTLAPGAMFPDDKRFAVMWMSRPSLSAIYNMEGVFNNVVVKLDPDTRANDVISKIDAVLNSYGGIGSVGRDRQISDWFLNGEMEQLKNMGRIGPPIFFAVAIYLLNIVISRWIELERGEIGLLKAFGYSTFQVSGHYIKFVMAITTLGIIIGCISGTWMGSGLANLYREFFHFPFLYFSFDYGVYVIAAGFSYLVAFLGTVSAVKKAALLSPAEAMVPQPPTVYQRGKSEDLIKGALGPTRMIVRHILRWPLRSGLTCLGISFGVAVLVSVMFFQDAMDYMIETQFTLIERQDVSVSFVDTKSADVLENVKSLPGVMAAEPFRFVPVIFRFKSNERRMSIRAITSDGSLSRILDNKEKAITLPKEGIVLSKKLSEMLDAGLGDIITAEIREGEKPTLNLPVTMITDTLIDSAAYMDIGVINRALKERNNISGAYVMLDKKYENDFYSSLKNIPSIAQVAVKETMIQAFRDTMEQNLNIMNFFNTIFAAVIAVGVVYNAARISLSERARELASLRVLGFTRGEASYILLGELALLMLAALPLGALLGYGLAWIWTLSLDTDLYRMPLIVSSATFGQAIAVVVTAGIATAVVIYRQIINLDLIGALKTRE
ncbi:MAG: ABC transporter permease, partial [Rhodospirillaceae bacterium]|nr:ABC transporter permease [Rhodospirillaceae bacterium]